MSPQFERATLGDSLIATRGLWNTSSAGMQMNMPVRGLLVPGIVAALVLASYLAVFGSLAHAQIQSSTATAAQKRADLTKHATGTFEVKVNPEPPEDKAEGSTLGRMSLDKQFHGDLEGTSKGQMLTAGTGVKGSAGYVAIERVTGTLNGRKGSFVLQHSGTMSKGALQMTITVVPDSGAGDLVGLSGKMMIIAAEGKHSYDFEYSLPDAH
jgi:hypothetical protein